MVVTDGTSDGPRAATPATLAADRRPRLATPALEPLMPLLVSGAVLAGLMLTLAVTPIGSGDYGQWLMTSRPYLGDDVPAYRDLGGVPPLVPVLLAAIRVVIPDPVSSLHVLTALLLAGIGIGFFAVGTLALGTRWAGALSVAIGLLVTDRFTDLFAFGGLLQAAALMFLCLAVAAFARAARSPLVRPWWYGAAAALGLTAVTHVGTGLIAVLAGGVLAAIVALAALSRAGWEPQPLVTQLRFPALALGLVGIAWLILLVPASDAYVTNPASLAYRGPDRLWADLFGRWPTTLVVVAGTVSLIFGTLRALVLRRVDGYLLVGTWAAVSWAVLAYSLVAGSATDFPRFATPLLAPLVVGAAGGTLWMVRGFATSLTEVGWRRAPTALVAVAVIGLVIVAAPLTIERHTRQATFYELRDADALAAAASWIDAELPAGAAVLSEVREGKWIEGLTGRPALFSQAVRYAFRPTEWQRSTDADALLRSTLTLTSGYVAAQFTGLAEEAQEPVPTGLLLRANHGGEFVDLLRLSPGAIAISAGGRTMTAASLVPIRATRTSAERLASIRNVWGAVDDPGFAFTQTLTAYADGTTLVLVLDAPAHELAVDLSPAFGMTITSLDVRDGEAVACFTELGNSSPCVRLRAPDDGVQFGAGSDGGLRVTSGGGGRVELHMTALTAGEASVGLGILEPADLVDTYDVRAVLLHEPDPAFGARARRLEGLGFHQVRAFGPYRVLLRDEDPAR